MKDLVTSLNRKWAIKLSVIHIDLDNYLPTCPIKNQ